MQLVGKEYLDDFKKKHADTRSWINTWVTDVESSDWKTPQDIKDKYASVSFPKGAVKVVIFNVKGNSYRLETKVAYNSGIVSVIWIGTHAEYDKRNKKGGK